MLRVVNRCISTIYNIAFSELPLKTEVFRDSHNKPHVHVYYGEFEAEIAIDGTLLAGKLPNRQYRMVTGWLALHEEEAYKAWNLAVQGIHFEKIAPMK